MSGLTPLLGAVAVALYAIYLVLRPKGKNGSAPLDFSQPLNEIKSNAHKYIVEFDKCEFKDSSYTSEIEQDQSDYRQAAALVGSSVGAYYTPVEKVETIQSVLFYKNENVYEGKRFLQTFAMEKTTLKFHVMKGNVILYIDKNDLDRYFFELVPE